jgi:hypothetical protein
MSGTSETVSPIGTVGTFSITKIEKPSGEEVIGWNAFNDDNCMVMLGLASYKYEVIGSAFSIMEASDA